MRPSIILPSKNVDVGHCVIVNDIDRPYGALVAVVTSIEGMDIYCKYLSSDKRLDIYNDGLGMRNPKECVTPVSLFGVEVHYNPNTNSYSCKRIAESTATYNDNTSRDWQETTPTINDARTEIVSMSLSVNDGGK